MVEGILAREQQESKVKAYQVISEVYERLRKGEIITRDDKIKYYLGKTTICTFKSIEDAGGGAMPYINNNEPAIFKAIISLSVAEGNRERSLLLPRIP